MSTETITTTSTESSSSLNITSYLAIPLKDLQPVRFDSSGNGDLLRRYRDNLADVADSTSLRRNLSDLRSTLPCLRQFEVVCYHYGDHFWLVYLDSLVSKLIDVPLYVGQRPVYVTHGDVELSGGMTDVPHLDEIDPRAVMSDSNLQLVKQQFPYAYGIRIHVWGFIDVLFNTQEALDQQRLLPFPARIGALGFAFIIGGHWPTSYSPLAHAIHPDHELNPEPSIKPSILPSTQVTANAEATRRSPSCIGLKISFEGRTYVTTTSHAWITRDEISKTRKKGFHLALPWTRQSLEPLRQLGRKEGPRTSSVHKEKVQLDSALRPARRPSPLVKVGKWMENILQVLRRRSRSRPHTDDGRIVTSVGVKVYLEGSGFPMGEIARTFDTLPQHIGKYLNLFPMAFEHDLSMIEAEEGKVLPRMVVPYWHPSILPQFAPPEKGLRFEEQEKSKKKTKPKPAHAFIVHHQARDHDRLTGTLVPESAKMVLINGADYFFEGEHLKRSLIWRTERDDHSVVGMSGSVLLLGKPTDEQVHALIFQNFETLVSDEIYTAAMNTKKPCVGLRSLVTLKGGFFLPESVQRHAFIKVEREEDLSRTLSYNQKNDKTSPSFIPPSTSDPVN